MGGIAVISHSGSSVPRKCTIVIGPRQQSPGREQDNEKCGRLSLLLGVGVAPYKAERCRSQHRPIQPLASPPLHEPAVQTASICGWELSQPIVAFPSKFTLGGR